MHTPPTLAVVVPCYNEHEVLPITCKLFKKEVELLVSEGKVSPQSHVLFVNDGSSDDTWEIIQGLAGGEAVYRGMSLSRNRGHQNALLAGLMEARHHADITISCDADGQDDISTMEAMVDAYLDGCDVVYGVRSSRETDTFFKRFSAQSFYKLLERMGVECVYNHADYRLMSSRALDALSEFHEVNLFLRGMVPLVGFKSTSVYYERHERMAGRSHYPLSKMLALAMNGITSLSVKPIRVITLLGVFVCTLGLIGAIWAIATAILGHGVHGWASTIVIVCLMGGAQILSLGVIGEYVGKIYLESKHRPRWIVSERTWGDEGKDADSHKGSDAQA